MDKDDLDYLSSLLRARLCGLNARARALAMNRELYPERFHYDRTGRGSTVDQERERAESILRKIQDAV